MASWLRPRDSGRVATDGLATRRRGSLRGGRIWHPFAAGAGVPCGYPQAVVSVNIEGVPATSKERSTERRARAAELAAAAKARDDRTLRQIVTVAVTLIVAITLGVGYVVYDATRTKPGPATPPATTQPSTPATPQATIRPTTPATPTKQATARPSTPATR
jgi:cell division septation protein DedD